jgi:hypothetical protein
VSTEGERPPSAMAPHPIVVRGIAGLACVKERDRVTRMYKRPHIVFNHLFVAIASLALAWMLSEILTESVIF